MNSSAEISEDGIKFANFPVVSVINVNTRSPPKNKTNVQSTQGEKMKIRAVMKMLIAGGG